MATLSPKINPRYNIIVFQRSADIKQREIVLLGSRLLIPAKKEITALVPGIKRFATIIK
jgi:hypothetical protein